MAAGDRIELKLTGVERTVKTLDRFSSRVQRRLVAQAMRRGAAVVRKEARDSAPVREGGFLRRSSSGPLRPRGFLRKNIKTQTRTGRQRRGSGVEIVVGPTREAFYGGILEGRADTEFEAWFSKAWERARRPAFNAAVKKLRQLVRSEAAKARRR